MGYLHAILNILLALGRMAAATSPAATRLDHDSVTRNHPYSGPGRPPCCTGHGATCPSVPLACVPRLRRICCKEQQCAMPRTLSRQVPLVAAVFSIVLLLIAAYGIHSVLLIQSATNRLTQRTVQQIDLNGHFTVITLRTLADAEAFATTQDDDELSGA